MNNNSKGKVIQMLSPENYIRKKARTLAVYECLVNSEWEDSKMANILVARKHSNGNVTVGFFLVDLFCLGVKDSFYFFNIPLFSYEEKKEEFLGRSDLMPIDYSLAHNIVFTGIEYAQEFGFKPHKDFTSVSKYILEEDTDDIELIEIECGLHGKPAYFRGPYDDDEKAVRIVAQLKKTVGSDNFIYVDKPDDWIDDEDIGFDLGEDDIEEFFDLFEDIDNLDDDGVERLHELTDWFFDELIDTNLVDEYYEKISEISEIKVLYDEIPDELLGLKPGDALATPELKGMVFKIIQLSSKEMNKAGKMWKELMKKSGEIPINYFLELLIFQKENSLEYKEKLNECFLKFPNYPLIRLIWLTKELIAENCNVDEISNLQLNYKEFFADRKSLSILELIQYLVFNIFSFLLVRDPSKFKAFEEVIFEMDLTDNKFEIIISLLNFVKINYVTEKLRQ